MHSLEPELQTLRPTLGDRVVDPLIARERREVFSIYPELRICGWLGATLLASAAGVVLKNNLDRIGPLALAIGMAIAAAACYTFVAWRRDRASLLDDYVLLLGALLVSGNIAFIESQWHLFDRDWRHHLLILAFIHGAGAYSYRSRVLLSLSITALASWMGAHPWMQEPGDYAGPAFSCAALLLVWRAIDRKLSSPASLSFRAAGSRGSGRRTVEESPDSLRPADSGAAHHPATDPRPTANRRPPTAFSPTFEHFAASLALLGAFALMLEDQLPGALAMLGVAVAVIAWGFRVRSEPFVLYGFVFAVIAVDVLLIEGLFDANDAAAAFLVILSIIAAIAGLLVLHARFKAVTR